MISEISVYTIVPSEIRNFRMTLTSSKINLQWDAPLYLSTATTNTTFSNLIPYAHYVGKIAACTSFCGLEKQIEFTLYRRVVLLFQRENLNQYHI